MTIPTKVVCSPYTIEFSAQGELYGLMYRGQRLGRCLRLGLNNNAEDMGTRLSITAFLMNGKSDWVLFRDLAGDPSSIAYDRPDNVLLRVVENSVVVKPHPTAQNAELLSFEVHGPFEIEVRQHSAPCTPPPYDYDEYDVFEDGPSTAVDPPETVWVRYCYPGLPPEQVEEAEAEEQKQEPKCECGAAATGSPGHADYCPLRSP